MSTEEPQETFEGMKRIKASERVRASSCHPRGLLRWCFGTKDVGDSSSSVKASVKSAAAMLGGLASAEAAERSSAELERAVAVRLGDAAILARAQWVQSLPPLDTSGPRERTCRDAFRDYAFA